MSRSYNTPRVSSPAAKKAAAVACVAFALIISGFTAPTDSAMRATSKHAADKPVLRIIAFGSSSTQGIGASAPAATYPAQLQTVLSQMMPTGKTVEVLNRGIGGEDVDDMVKRLKADVIERKPDIVIWQTGSNDPMRNVPIDRFETETRDGIKAMQQAGAEVILMEPQWCPRLEKADGANLFRATIRRLGQELKVPVIRRSDLMHKWIAEGRMTQAQMLASDGLHMADRGYAALAREIAPQVLKTASGRIATPVALHSN